MDDLRRRFADLDRVPAPDLWDTIDRRAAELGPISRLTPVSVPALHLGRSSSRSFILIAAAAMVLIALVAGALAMGSGPVKRPVGMAADPSTAPPDLASPSSATTNAPSQTSSPRPAVGLVAYIVSQTRLTGEAGCTRPVRCIVNRIRVVHADGSDARELPPDPSGIRELVGWSPDGTRLLYQDDFGNLVMTDADGTSPVVMSENALCPDKVKDDNCQAVLDDDGLAISPDGARFAYEVLEGRDLEVSTLVTNELSSGRVRRLQSTRAEAKIPCRTAASEGDNGRPSWSPDGSRLVFERQVIGPPHNGACQATVIVVDADGSDLRQLAPPKVVALWPSWSPDGTRIAFHTAAPQPSYPSDGAVTADIYTVRPDGTGLQQLTDDGTSVMARWTSDGRIVYRHLRSMGTEDERPELWIMNGDGSGKMRIPDDDLRLLTSLGCSICFYGPAGVTGEAYWQPQP